MKSSKFNIILINLYEFLSKVCLESQTNIFILKNRWCLENIISNKHSSRDAYKRSMKLIDVFDQLEKIEFENVYHERIVHKGYLFLIVIPGGNLKPYYTVDYSNCSLHFI